MRFPTCISIRSILDNNLLVRFTLENLLTKQVSRKNKDKFVLLQFQKNLRLEFTKQQQQQFIPDNLKYKYFFKLSPQVYQNISFLKQRINKSKLVQFFQHVLSTNEHAHSLREWESMGAPPPPFKKCDFGVWGVLVASLGNLHTFSLKNRLRQLL